MGEPSGLVLSLSSLRAQTVRTSQLVECRQTTTGGSDFASFFFGSHPAAAGGGFPASNNPA